MNRSSHQECGIFRGGPYIYFRKIHLVLETKTYQVFSCIHRILPLDFRLCLSLFFMLESQAHIAMPGIQTQVLVLAKQVLLPTKPVPKCACERHYSRDGAMAVAVHVLQHRRRGHLLTEVMVCIRSESVIAINQGHK